MKRVEVGISEVVVLADSEARLQTGPLGSGVAVTAWDPTTRIGGVLHFVLPSSSTSREKAATRPAMFADTGLRLLLSRLRTAGASREELVVKLVGGGSLRRGATLFDMGGRNLSSILASLNEAELEVAARDVGGPRPRSARLELRTGRVWVSTRHEEVPL